MAGKRAETLYNVMLLIDHYTLGRAFDGLTQDEFVWEPHPGAWGLRRRSECTTPTPLGSDEGEWVVDFDEQLAVAADEGNAVEPMTTIGWLLAHIASAPGGAAQLDVVGGPVAAGTPGTYRQMWSYNIFPTPEEGIATFRDGWSALARGLRTTSDKMLEREYDEFHGPTTGAQFLAAMLNEVSHHGTQICMLRDLYRQRPQ